MAKRPLIEAEKRDIQGKRAVARLRRTGVVPGVIYGSGRETQMLTVEDERLREVIESRSKMVDLKIGATTESAMIKDVQYDHLSTSIYHVDFERIDLSEIVRVQVPVETHGQPLGAKSGGIMDVVRKHITIECKAGDIPNELTVEVADLDIGQALTVAQVKLPEGVKAVDDPAGIVITILAPRKEEEVAAAEAAPAEELAEPEVISTRKEKEEEEEEVEEEK